MLHLVHLLVVGHDLYRPMPDLRGHVVPRMQDELQALKRDVLAPMREQLRETAEGNKDADSYLGRDDCGSIASPRLDFT